MQQWYAFRLFRGARKRFLQKLQGDGIRSYSIEKVTREIGFDYQETEIRTLLFPSLIFIFATREYVDEIKTDPQSSAYPYTEPGTGEPAAIPEREMEILMFVNEASGYKLDAYEGDLLKGDHVRVLDGVFKGAEGYILRIKGDRRFVVSINGVVAVATTYIPKSFLQKID